MSLNQQMIVLEVNEVPLRIFRHFASLRPGSHLERLLKNANVLETKALDVPESFLYPCQTWASLNTGAPYGCHKIHWYNDPKPDEFPLYWKLLATSGRTVGIVNTLHSSPAGAFATSNPNYKFLIPDCFAPDSWTRPGYYEPFQSLNRKAVTANGRQVTMSAPVREAALTALNIPRFGIRFQTLVEGASLVLNIVRHKVNRERLRTLQFPLVADVFLKEFQSHQPDLAVLFTNHVAANLHRYWYALFPEDYPEKIYDQEWMNKYADEIGASVDMLNQYLGKLMTLAEKTQRVLVVVSSMGQNANPKLTLKQRQSQAFDYRLDDVDKLVRKLLVSDLSFDVQSAMVPQYVVAFQTLEAADKAMAEMSQTSRTVKGIGLLLDQNREVITISAVPSQSADNFEIRGQSYTCRELGFQRFEIEDHHSGCHAPEGSLIIYNSKTTQASQASINYLEYAPAILKHFGLEPLPFMVEPSFRF